MSKDLCGELILKADRADIYLLKANNRNTTTKCEIYSRRQWRCSGVFFDNFEHISHLALVFLLLTLNM